MSNQPFRCPREGWTDYVSLLLRVAAFLVRSVRCPPEGYVHPVRPSVQLAVEGALGALEGGDAWARLMGMHGLFASAFLHEEAEGGDRQSFADPVARFVAASSVHASGQWRDADLMTPLLAKLTFGVRGAAVAAIFLECGGEGYQEGLHG